MTDHHVEVVRLGPIERHPNADSLGITRVADFPVIVKLGEFREGDLAVYVPVDSVVPTDDERWAFLDGQRRIRARRLRGIFSMGLLTSADPSWTEGQDVAEQLGITHYEPEIAGHSFGSTYDGDESDPGFMPRYTDIENLRRWPNVFEDGETVVITEKLHGENARFMFQDGRLWVGSRTRIKRPGIGAWWRGAEQLELATRLAEAPGFAFYAESHGYTGGFPYGVEAGRVALRFFDVYDCGTRCYLDHERAIALMKRLGLEPVPQLFLGLWSKDRALELAEGSSTLDQRHVREGVVIKPLIERWHDRLGRVILKLHGEAFLTRKKQ